MSAARRAPRRLLRAVRMHDGRRALVDQRRDHLRADGARLLAMGRGGPPRRDVPWAADARLPH
eukprot:123411-Prymnesium_polylepis.1